MPAIGTLITFAPGTTILSADVNANFATIKASVNTYGLFVDVPATISAVYTHTGAAVFQGGVTLNGATPNLTVGGTLGVTGASTLTGAVSLGATLGVTGAATLSSTLAVTGASTLTGNVAAQGTLTVTGVLTASGGVTGTLTGNVTGNVTGALTGNASTATVLQTARTINGVTFDGSANITVTAAAGTLTGATLAAGVTASSLTTFGTLAGNLLFADATYDIGASGATRPRTGYFSTSVIAPLLNNTGSTITLRGVTYTLPSADGTSGQVLQTNGAAVLTWAAASSGFVTGSGTTGTLIKWTGSAAGGNSVLTEASGVISGATAIAIGTNPSTTGTLRLPASATIAARNAGNSSNLRLLYVDGADNLYLGAENVLYLGESNHRWPLVDGTSGQVLQTNGGGVLSWATPAGGGGISGLTTGKLPQAASSTTLSDSVISQSGTAITIGGNLTLSNSGTLTVPGAAALSSTLAVTGASTLTGNVAAQGTLTVTGLLTASANALVSGTLTVGGAAALNGNTTLGDATSDTITFTGRVASDVLPSVDGTYNLGSNAATKQWLAVYLTGGIYVAGAQVLATQVPGFNPTFTQAANKSAALDASSTPAGLGQAAKLADLQITNAFLRALYNAMAAHGLLTT